MKILETISNNSPHDFARENIPSEDLTNGGETLYFASLSLFTDVFSFYTPVIASEPLLYISSVPVRAGKIMKGRARR